MTRLIPTFTGMLLLLAVAGAQAAPAVPGSWSPELKTTTVMLIDNGFDSRELIELTKDMHDAEFTQDEIVAVHGAIAQAIAAGLATSPIYSKAREGLAKQVPAQTLIHAIKRIKSRHTDAYKAAARFHDNEAARKELAQIIAGAEAAGMQTEDIMRVNEALLIRSRWNPRTRQQKMLYNGAFSSSRKMARRGVDSALIGHIVSSLVHKGASGKEMLDVTRAIEQQRSGLSIHERAQICSRVIANEKSMVEVMHALQQPATYVKGDSDGESQHGTPAGAGSSKAANNDSGATSGGSKQERGGNKASNSGSNASGKGKAGAPSP